MMDKDVTSEGPVERTDRPRASDALEARKTNAHYTLEQWLGFLDHAALSVGFPGRIAADTGPDSWRDYYDEGYTPMAALAEDLHHAA
jgi:hypothetical protein